MVDREWDLHPRVWNIVDGYMVRVLAGCNMGRMFLLAESKRVGTPCSRKYVLDRVPGIYLGYIRSRYFQLAVAAPLNTHLGKPSSQMRPPSSLVEYIPVLFRT